MTKFSIILVSVLVSVTIANAMNPAYRTSYNQYPVNEQSPYMNLQKKIPCLRDKNKEEYSSKSDEKYGKSYPEEDCEKNEERESYPPIVEKQNYDQKYQVNRREQKPYQTEYKDRKTYTPIVERRDYGQIYEQNGRVQKPYQTEYEDRGSYRAMDERRDYEQSYQGNGPNPNPYHTEYEDRGSYRAMDERRDYGQNYLGNGPEPNPYQTGYDRGSYPPMMERRDYGQSYLGNGPEPNPYQTGYDRGSYPLMDERRDYGQNYLGNGPEPNPYQTGYDRGSYPPMMERRDYDQNYLGNGPEPNPYQTGYDRGSYPLMDERRDYGQSYLGNGPEPNPYQTGYYRGSYSPMVERRDYGQRYQEERLNQIPNQPMQYGQYGQQSFGRSDYLGGQYINERYPDKQPNFVEDKYLFNQQNAEMLHQNAHHDMYQSVKPYQLMPEYQEHKEYGVVPYIPLYTPEKPIMSEYPLKDRLGEHKAYGYDAYRVAPGERGEPRESYDIEIPVFDPRPLKEINKQAKKQATGSRESLWSTLRNDLEKLRQDAKAKHSKVDAQAYGGKMRSDRPY